MPQISQTIICEYPCAPLWRGRSVFGRAVPDLDISQIAFAVVARADLNWKSALGCAGLARRGELIVQPLKHRESTVVGTQFQYPVACMFDLTTSLEYDLLYHCLHASAHGRIAQWCVFANERVLTNQAQDVRCHRCQSADQKVGVNLADWQALQVHFGLELGMELLVGGVFFVQIDDVLHRELVLQCCRPAFQLVRGQQLCVAVLDDGVTRCVAVYALLYASCLFFFSARDVHHKLIPVHGHVAAGQSTKVHRPGCVLVRQQALVEFAGKLKPRGRMGVYELAQSRTRRHHAYIQQTGEEAVTPKFFDSIEVVLALHQQAQVGLRIIADGDAANPDRKLTVNANTDSEGFEVLPSQGQSCIGGEVVGRLLIIKLVKFEFTFWVSRT